MMSGLIASARRLRGRFPTPRKPSAVAVDRPETGAVVARLIYAIATDCNR
jgi:hypothetical protein